ncbi:hypothetical protein PMIT1323_01926 [Prochlorococcus marinus str. MIT 1323]|nr:hypothetical protein PMIT1323_01926 [Prochlorococcus marinus str. MIT 1323]
MITMFNNIVIIQLAAILAACSYDKDEAIIKWGGLLVAVVTLVVGLVQG